MGPGTRELRQDGRRRADLLRSKIIADHFLQSFADALFGDGVEITFPQNGVNDRYILVTGIWGDWRERNDVSRERRRRAGRSPATFRSGRNLRDILQAVPVFLSIWQGQDQGEKQL